MAAVATNTSGISLDGVSFGYGKASVVTSLSLAVEPGRFLVLLGANGAGKSTLFNLIAGQYRPRSGRVRVLGFDMSRQRVAAARHLGMVFQHSTLDRELSVAQNITYSAGLYGLRLSREEIERHLIAFGLQHELRTPVLRLSGGNQRRLEIARALVHQPKVLLLDEPTVGLDPQTKAMIVDHVHQLAAGGVTVVWITHLIDEITAGDEVAILHRGKLVARDQYKQLGGKQGISDFLSGHHQP